MHTKQSPPNDFINSHAVFGTLLFDSREKDLYYKPNKASIIQKPTVKKPHEDHENIFSFLSDYKKKEIDRTLATTTSSLLRPPVCRVCLKDEDLSYLKPKKHAQTTTTTQAYSDINPLLPHESSLLFQTYFSRPLQESKESHEKRPFATNGKRQPPGLLSSSYLHYLASLKPLPTIDSTEEPGFEEVELKIPDEVYCSPSPCGKHAECFVKEIQYRRNGSKKRVADCKCKGDLIGNPFMECFALTKEEPNFVAFNTSNNDSIHFHKGLGFSHGRNKVQDSNNVTKINEKGDQSVT